jgi:hypothetical protein
MSPSLVTITFGHSPAWHRQGSPTSGTTLVPARNPADYGKARRDPMAHRHLPHRAGPVDAAADLHIAVEAGR